MAVAGNGVGAAGGFDPNLGPKHSGRYMYGGDLRHGDALVVAAKPARLHAAHTQGADHESSREQKIALGPAAGRKGLGQRLGGGRGRSYTHSRAPFFQTQM